MPDPDTSANLLKDFLAGRDIECPQCEYNLRDLQNDRCPECGEELVLRVNLAEPKQRLVIAGLIGLSAGGGFNGLLLLYLPIMMIREGGLHSPNAYRFLSVNALGLLIESKAIWIWLRQWKRIRRAPPSRQLVLVFACWALALMDILLFALTVR